MDLGEDTCGFEEGIVAIVAIVAIVTIITIVIIIPIAYFQLKQQIFYLI